MSASADSDQPALAHLFHTVHATQQQQPASLTSSSSATSSSSSSSSSSDSSLAAAPLSSSLSSTRHLRVQAGLAATSRSHVAMELDSSDDKRSDLHDHYKDDDGSGSGSSAGMRDGESDAAAAAAPLSHSKQSVHNPSSSSSSLAHSSDRSPPRSILKRSSGRKRSLRWDESNLAVNESEKVPRMKVDEPKTPYHAAHSSAAALSSMDDSSTGAHEASSGRSSFSSEQHRSAFDQQRVDTVSRTPHSHTKHTRTLTEDNHAAIKTRQER